MIGKFVAIIGFLILVASIPARAQEEPKWSLNVGGGFGNPVASASDFVGIGGNFTAGGGYELSDVIGVDGEFMWQGLPIKRRVLDQIGAPDGNSNLYSVTGNVMFRIPTASRFSGYVIGVIDPHGSVKKDA